MLRALALACLVLAGCESCGTEGVHHLPDARDPLDVMPDAFGPTGGAMLVTLSPPDLPPISTWSGALAYRIAKNGDPAMPITGIDKSQLRDPVDVLYRAAASEVLISNRHGNNSGDGVPGSISRFAYEPTTQAFTPTGEILGAALIAPHQIALHPQTGELFAATRDSGVARFTFAGNTAMPDGTISNGPARGVAIAPDGARLYVTTASNVIRQFALPAGTELAALTLPGTQNLHYMAIRGGQLYVAALDAGMVHRFQILPDDSLAALPGIAAPQNPVAVAFSEDGNEMFVTGHRSSSLIARYEYEAAFDAWTGTTDVMTSGSLGGVAMLPIR